MIKMLRGSEKTNSYVPAFWNLTDDPFLAFRGAGQNYNAFLAVAGGFKPWICSDGFSDGKRMSDDFSKIIKTKKGTTLLVPCGQSEEEKILLITALGGFRGDFGRIEAVGAEILWKNSSCMHCAPVAHIVARITNPNGYVLVESGRRSSTGEVGVYSWKGGYFEMETEEYEAAVELGLLFSKNDREEEDLSVCKKRRKEEEDSRKAKAEFANELEVISDRLKACSRRGIELLDTFFVGPDCQGKFRKIMYKKEEVDKVRKIAEEAEASAAEWKAYKLWKPVFKAAAEGHKFANDEKRFMCYLNFARVEIGGEKKTYNYELEGFLEFVKDLEIHDEAFAAL